jgi:hypothetical protein
VAFLHFLNNVFLKKIVSAVAETYETINTFHNVGRLQLQLQRISQKIAHHGMAMTGQVGISLELKRGKILGKHVNARF